MTAPDPRVGEIEARLAAAEPGPWFLDSDGISIYYVFHNGDTLDRDRLAESSGADAEFIAHAPADVAYLLAELRKAHEALARVEAVAARLNSDADNANEGAKYAAEMNDGASLRSFETERFAYQQAERLIRAAVAAANGDGR